VTFPGGKTFLTKPFNLTSSLTLQIDGTVKFVSPNNTDGDWGLDFVRGTACDLDERSPTNWACPVSASSQAPGSPTICAGGYRCFNQSAGPACQKYCHPTRNSSVWQLVPSYPSWNSVAPAGQAPPPPGLRYQSLLMAAHAHDIKITGSGTIDGQGQWWWGTTEKPGNNQSLHPWQTYGRPRLVEFFNCTRVEMSGVTVKNSPFWTVNFYNTSEVWAHHLTIRNLKDGWGWGAPNADGIDCNSCKDSIIEHNDISVGDDHIAVKSVRREHAARRSPLRSFPLMHSQGVVSCA
jgi:polygalacturonase